MKNNIKLYKALYRPKMLLSITNNDNCVKQAPKLTL